MLAADAVLVDLVAGLRVDAGEDAGVVDQVDQIVDEDERTVGQDASEAQVKAVAAARDARAAAERSLDRIGNATRENWDALRDEIDDAADAAEARVRELRPDVKPMGGTGGPS